MKRIKDLQVKAEDLRGKVVKFAVDMDYETPVYPDQRGQVEEWIQAHHDILKEIMKLRVAIQRTNLATPVTIELNGRGVTKSIAEWIHRRRDLAKTEMEMWVGLGRKESSGQVREGQIQTSAGEKKDVKIRRYYDPVKRDEAVDQYRSEPTQIDSVLETANAVTDLIEA